MKPYRVTLLGFTNVEPNKTRLENLFKNNYTGWRESFSFPVDGTVKWLNKYGDPVVTPDFPAHALLLSFFEYELTT